MNLTPAETRAARNAVEAALTDLRDAGLSVLGAQAGAVIGDPGGGRSDMIRLTIEDVLCIGLAAIPPKEIEPA